MRKAQSAIEYLFMVAAALILVLMAARVVSGSMRSLNQAVSDYIESVRRQLLENL